MQRLSGTAKELARRMSPQEMLQGGTVDGVQLDPLSLLMDGLQRRYGQLTEEARLETLTAMMNFRRRPHEGVSDLLT